MFLLSCKWRFQTKVMSGMSEFSIKIKPRRRRRKNFLKYSEEIFYITKWYIEKEGRLKGVPILLSNIITPNNKFAFCMTLNNLLKQLSDLTTLINADRIVKPTIYTPSHRIFTDHFV